MDVWHPDLSMAERRALERLSYVRPKERQLRHKDKTADQLILSQLTDLSGSKHPDQNDNLYQDYSHHYNAKKAT